jgi:16S rRNA processing protein RimM
VPRAVLPEAGEGHYYLADLVGLEVVNASGVALGVVKRMFTNGAQDVMEVTGNGKTRLLPWVPSVVKTVDLPQKQVHVEWDADW